MSLYSTTPLSIGQTIDAGFRAYRQVFLKVLPVSFTVALLGEAPDLTRHFYADSPGFSWMLVLGLGAALLVWLVVYFTLYNGWLAALDCALDEKPVPGLGEVFALGSGTVGATIGAGLLYALAVCAGLLLLVVPGFYLMVALMFFWIFTVLERRGAVDSLSASRALVKGHWWRVTAVLSVAGLVYFVGLAAIVSVFGMLFGLSSISGAGTLGDVADITLGKSPAAPDMKLGGEMAILFVQVTATTVLLPLWNTISLVLYRDLKLRKSGADLAARAATA